MLCPVDLTNLREMINDNRELEQKLFKNFYNCADKCLSHLETAFQKNEHELWRSNAHALKGISLNLGAMNLGSLCAKAQQAFEAPPPEKQQLFTEIKTAFDEAKAYLKTL